jgi:hypothetical protein
LQKLFRYAAPILISNESINLQLGKVVIPEKWNYVLQTTRILLAHCTLTGNQTGIFRLIANNIRNLYRLYDIDLSDKDAWEDVLDEGVYYTLPNENGEFYIPLDDYEKLIITLQPSNFEQMKREFDGYGQRKEFVKAKGIFGHNIYICW